MPPFDINAALSDPRVALGIGLLTTRTPQEGISQGVGLLSKQSEMERERKKQQMDEEYKKAVLEMKQREAYQGKLPTGYRYGADGNAELIPGVDESYGKRNDPFSIPVPAYDPVTGKLVFATKGSLPGSNLQPPEAAPETTKTKDLPTPAINKLDDLRGQYDQMTRLNSDFKDDYGGNTADWTGNLENWAGKKFGDSGQAQWWQDYQDYTNKVRNELFGSALTPSEQAEFAKAMISPGMEPNQIKKNLKRQAGIIETGLKRRVGVYRKGNYNPDQLDEYYVEKSGVGDSPPSAPPDISSEETKTIGGKTYIKSGGKWYEQ